MDVGYQDMLPESSVPPALQQSANGSEGYTIGSHSIGDGLQLLIFSVLSLLAFATILIIGSFSVISMILFPVAEILTLCRYAKRDWKRCSQFYRKLIGKVFRFTKGLWD